MVDLKRFFAVSPVNEFEQSEHMAMHERRHFVITKLWSTVNLSCSRILDCKSMCPFSITEMFVFVYKRALNFHGNMITWMLLQNLGHTDSQSRVCERRCS